MTETYNVQEAMAKIKAAKAAKEAAATSPATQPPAALTPPTTVTAPPAPVTALAQPVCPPNCPPEVWATLPPDVQATVALGPQGQAEPVNPPEATQGLVESAAGEPAKPVEEKPKKGRGRGKGKAEMPPDPSPSDQLLLEELKGIRVGLNNQTVSVCEAIDQQTEAIKALTGAMLEAAAILAGK